MKYWAEFNSIDGRAYRIEIITASNGSDTKFKLSGKPFVASVKGDDKMLYSPIRCGGATVGLLSEKYIFDLYSGQAKGVKVTLYEEKESGYAVRWAGYVSPTIYDQGHDQYWEEISLDCVDGVAVLKDLPFKAPEKSIRTFADIIFQCLKESGCFKAFYISDNVQLTADGKDSVIEKFRISDSNFFDARKDMAQTDDDLAWSCYDVLYHVIQWLGYTLTVHGDEVFIIDYDAVAAGLNTYHRYSLEEDSIGTPAYVTKSFSKNITGNDYAANGARVSLDEIYNKVTVRDEFNTYDNLFPTFGDESLETNLTAPDDQIYQDALSGIAPIKFYDIFEADPENGVHQPFVFFYDQAPNTGEYRFNILKFMDSPVFTFHKYMSRVDITVNEPLWGEGNFRYSNMMLHNGAFYYRYAYFTLKIDSASDIIKMNHLNTLYHDPAYRALPAKQRLDKVFSILQRIDNIAKIKTSPVILLKNSTTENQRFGPGDDVHLNDATDNDITKNYPFVTLKDTFKTSSIFGGKNHFLRIKGKISYHADHFTPHPLSTEYANKLEFSGDKKYGSEGYIWCKVKWGTQWWDGGEWQKYDCWFKLYFWDFDGSDYKWKNSEHYAKEFDIVSNKKDDSTFLGEDGYIITAPPEGNLEGVPEISFTTRDMRGDSRRSHWHPKGTKEDNFYCRYYSECVFITDLSITAEVSPGFLSDADLDSDTCYTNVIDNGSVSPMDEISFKVCTDDGKKPSYSSVDFMVGSQSSFVTTTYNKALRNKERGTTGCDGADGALRQEEHMVFKTASHYETPKVVFQCNLHNEDFPPYATFTDASFGSRSFIIQETETDFRFNSVALTITQKD